MAPVLVRDPRRVRIPAWWLGWPAAGWWTGTDGPSGGVGRPGGLRRALERAGLTEGVWPARWRAASPALRRFVAHHHRVTGFAHVVRAAYGGPGQRAAARLAMHLADRTVARHGTARGVLSFEPGLAPGAGTGRVPVQTLLARLGTTRWLRLLPSRPVGRGAAALRRYDRAQYGAGHVRWLTPADLGGRAPRSLGARRIAP